MIKIISSPNSYLSQEAKGFSHFQNSGNLLFRITFYQLSPPESLSVLLKHILPVLLPFSSN